MRTAADVAFDSDAAADEEAGVERVAMGEVESAEKEREEDDEEDPTILLADALSVATLVALRLAASSPVRSDSGVLQAVEISKTARCEARSIL